MEFMPGAIEALFRLNQAGFKQIVNTARMNPYDPWTSMLIDPAKVEAEKQYVRAALDAKGLSFVDIWDRPGKPSGSAYTDDKGWRYTGTAGAWKALANKLIIALDGEAPLFPAFDLTRAE